MEQGRDGFPIALIARESPESPDAPDLAFIDQPLQRVGHDNPP
jgi:hypothetical protein